MIKKIKLREKKLQGFQAKMIKFCIMSIGKETHKTSMTGWRQRKNFNYNIQTK